MQLIEPRQVWSAEFPFDDDPSLSKIRPVLVLKVDREANSVSVLSMKITSVAPRDKYDFTLEDWANIPIDHESTVRPAHVKYLPLDNLKEYLGYISDRDWDKATDRFMQVLRDRDIL